MTKKLEEKVVYCKHCREVIEKRGEVWVHSAGFSQHARKPYYHRAEPQDQKGECEYQR